MIKCVFFTSEFQVTYFSQYVIIQKRFLYMPNVHVVFVPFVCAEV